MNEHLFFYECDFGQGAVMARDPDHARRLAVLEAGTFASVRNVYRPTDEQIAFRKAMGGSYE